MLLIIRFLHGAVAMKERWLEDGIIAFAALVILVAVVYGTQFIYEIANTMYEEHEQTATRDTTLQANNSQLKQRLIAKDQEISSLRSPVKQETTVFRLDTVMTP